MPKKTATMTSAADSSSLDAQEQAAPGSSYRADAKRVRLESKNRLAELRRARANRRPARTPEPDEAVTPANSSGMDDPAVSNADEPASLSPVAEEPEPTADPISSDTASAATVEDTDAAEPSEDAPLVEAPLVEAPTPPQKPAAKKATRSSVKRAPRKKSPAKKPAKATAKLDADTGQTDCGGIVMTVSQAASDVARNASDPSVPEDEATSAAIIQTATAPTDLSELPGIGNGLVWLLQDAGVETMADLAAADPDDLTAKLGLVGELINIESWIQFAAGRRG